MKEPPPVGVQPPSEPHGGRDWGALERSPAPLRFQVAAKLRAAIMEGVLRPGERLVERSLCEKLGVSRTLFREAVRQLEAERILAIVPNRGAVVHKLSAAEVGDLFDMTGVLEGLCASYFASRGTTAEIAELGHRLAALESALTSGEADQIRHCKYEYYEMLLSGSHSEPIQGILRQLEARLSQVWSTSVHRPGRVPKAIQEIRRVFKAIKARDGNAAFEASRVLARNASVGPRMAMEQRTPEPAK